MRRGALRLSSVLWFGTMVACRPGAPSEPDCAVASGILFEGGTVLTMDPERPQSDALFVRVNWVNALGDEARRHENVPDRCVRRVDLAGGTIIPGIIDGHTHVRELGMDAIKVDLVGVETIEDIVGRLKTARPEPEAGAWIVGQGWDEGAFASKGYPDRALLDEAFPNNPVALESLHGFAGMYNGAALAIAGVDEKTPDPEGGTILRRENGKPTGVMLALGQRLVNQHVPAPSQEQLRKAIVEGLSIMASAGVTSVHEAGMSAEDVEAYQALAGAGALPIRVYGMLTGNDAALMDTWFERGPLEHPSGFLDIRGIKVFYDGSLGSRTAVLGAPYADAPEHAAPAERISPERIVELGRRAAETGFQLAVHAIGDEGNQRVLNAYAEGLQGHPELDHRWRIEHAQVVTPDFFATAAEMGVIASMQPSHAVGDSDWAEARLGPERVQRAYAWRSMLDAGVRLILNSDLPGEPWKPMQTLYFAVTRSKLDASPAGGWYPKQALSTEEALAAMTRDSAYAAFAEDKLGQLRPGYLADFVVLGANPLEVEPGELADIEVRETWVGAVRVWPRDDA